MLPVFEIKVTSNRRMHYSGSVLVAAQDAASALALLAETNEIVELETEWAKVDGSYSPVVIDNLMWEGQAAVVKNCIQHEDYWPGA
jgi:hypothetical protein